MQNQIKSLSFFLLFFLPWSVLAQATPTIGEVDLVVESESYVPNFYLGRAEPTTGNKLRLVAIPLNANPNAFTYRWSIGGRKLPQNGPTITITAPIGDSVLVSLSVIDKNGRLWAERNEIIAIAKPEIIFYEENILRGNKSLAIGNEYLMVGNENTIYAEPFFFGTPTASSLKAEWTINSQLIEYGANSWQRLNLKRPEDTAVKYKIKLDVINKNNLGESATRTFNLNFGL